MAQDFPRNNLPKGRCWNMVDFIPQQLGAPIVERGGWTYAASSLTTVDASASFVQALAWAPFTAGSQIVAITDDGHLVRYDGSLTDAGSVVGNGGTYQNPFMHRESLIILAADGSTVPKKWDGSSATSLTAAPVGRYGCMFNNYTWIGGTTANPNRGYASAVGDPTAYSLTGTGASYLDVGFPIKGMAALPNAMLWFGQYRTARITGSTPPPGTDMTITDPVFNYGVNDARSIAVNGSLAAFTNDIGVFLTNGTITPEDLTKSCGISRYWRNLVSGRDDTWTIAGGWYGDVYVVCVMALGVFKDTIAFDTTRRVAYRISNLKTRAFASSGQTGQELYAGSRAEARILQLSTMWSPDSSHYSDGDGNPVLGVYESPFYDTQKVGSQRWRDLYVTYDLRAPIGKFPAFDVYYCSSPEATATYTGFAAGVSPTSQKTVVREPLHLKSRGLGFKIVRSTDGSAAFRVYGLGATVYTREGSRLDV